MKIIPRRLSESVTRAYLAAGRPSFGQDPLEECLPEALRKYLPSFLSHVFDAALRLCPS